MSSTVEAMIPIDEKVPETKVPCEKFGQILATISACLASMACGSTLSWSSPCLGELEDYNSTTAFHISPAEASWAGALLPIGALFSAIPAGYSADRFGRKPSILSLIIPLSLSWMFIIFAVNTWMLYIGRILSGIGTGATCVLVPMYIAEITIDKLRGPLCSLFALFLCTGITLTFIIATFAKYTLLSTLLAFLPILCFISFIFMPESPKYLIKINKDKAANKSMMFLRGKNFDFSQEVLEMKKTVEIGAPEKATLKDLFQNRDYFRCLVACVVMFLFQQLSGINAVIFYTVPIFKASKSNMDPIISSILVASIQVFVIILVIFIIDKQGRKTYVLQTSVLNAVSLFSLGLYFNLRHLGVSFAFFDLIPLASLMLYIFSFSLALGPIPWLILGELLPPEIVGPISGIAVMVNWFTGFVVTKSFGPMMSNLGPFITFYFFAIFNILCTLSVYFLVPETRGKSIPEIWATWKK